MDNCIECGRPIKDGEERCSICIKQANCDHDWDNKEFPARCRKCHVQNSIDADTLNVLTGCGKQWSFQGCAK